jgi:hypothetical protein
MRILWASVELRLSGYSVARSKSNSDYPRLYTAGGNTAPFYTQKCCVKATQTIEFDREHCLNCNMSCHEIILFTLSHCEQNLRVQDGHYQKTGIEHNLNPIPNPVAIILRTIKSKDSWVCNGGKHKSYRLLSYDAVWSGKYFRRNVQPLAWSLKKWAFDREHWDRILLRKFCKNLPTLRHCRYIREMLSSSLHQEKYGVLSFAFIRSFTKVPGWRLDESVLVHSANCVNKREREREREREESWGVVVRDTTVSRGV